MDKQELINIEPITDHEIIDRVMRGEKDLYAIIVRKYNLRLYRICMSIVNDDSIVEDVMQVAYIKAYENLAKFGWNASFSTWLTRILINESLLRIKNRKKSIYMDDVIIDLERYRQQDSSVPTPHTKMINSELKGILEGAINKLPEKYRTVFIMRVIEDMNVAETTACLDISEVNVKVRLNRARALLKESLKEFYKQEDILQFHLSRCQRVVDQVLQTTTPYLI